MAGATYRLPLLKIILFIMLMSGYRLVAQAAADGDSGNGLEEDLQEKAPETGRARVPHVFVGVLARNVAYLLSNFFGGLEQLDYPKERMTIW